MHLDSNQESSSKSSRKPKPDRDSIPVQPTDLAERMIALQRKNAAATRRERVERPERMPAAISTTRPDKSPRVTHPPSTSRPTPVSPRRHYPSSPHLVIPRQSAEEADSDDFTRRLKISSPGPRSSAPSKPHLSKLFNPESDPIPMRRTAEPESISDTASSSYVSRSAAPATHIREGAQRQLFDHRKDDPVRFSVRARPGRPTPTPKSSGDYVSASSTSSYANSMTSSTFTLSSTTDGSSASSALFDRQGQPNEEPGNNVFAVQLKKLYRTITNLEEKVKLEDAVDDAADDAAWIMLKGKEQETEDLEKEKWKKQIADHKRLAENMHNLLEISLAPSVPASLRNIPQKYNIILRLWTYAFNKLLESLRRASFTSPLALEHLQDFIYYAYTFYTGLMEEPSLSSFKSGWLEALGDLARYRMAIAAMVTASSGSGPALTTAAVSKVATDSLGARASDLPHVEDPPAPKSVSDAPAARIDDSPSPSVGLAAARLLDVEPEKERWRCVARDWYAAGLADTPGTGKLHHHLGLLSREVDGEEMRAVYHFVKSMTTLHPFMTSRESVLPIWSATAQSRRSLPDARVSDLFVLLHGMLFTNIQLDDFQPTLARFIERLEIEGAEEREWIMMAIINIGAMLEYGKPSGVLKHAGGVGARAAVAPRVITKRAVVEEDVDMEDIPTTAVVRLGAPDYEIRGTAPAVTMSPPSPPMSEVEGGVSAPPTPEHPAPFRLALQLTFMMLSHVLRYPIRKTSQFARSSLNPYLTVLLTFLLTVLKHAQTLEVLERSVPWEELAVFFATVPRGVMAAQGLGSAKTTPGDRWAMLTSGCAPPLPEDWCLRGMEWVGRRVYERGFWKSGEERRAEVEVLNQNEDGEVTDGHIEDDNEEEGDKSGGVGSEIGRRWARVARCGVGISGVVSGFTWVEGSRVWKVEGFLAEKVARWREEDRIEREEEERRRIGTRWEDDSMDVDEDGFVDDDVSESEDDERDSEEVKELKARRRYLKSLLHSAQHGSVSSSPPRRPRPRAARPQAASRPALAVVPGFTVLVIDTNILLSSLPMFASVVESLRWTVIVPLPVIMELDGLSTNTSQLGEAAQAAMAYIQSHVKSHSMSMKVQTSKGNYLTTLSVRTEQVDFADGTSDRNMDDLILKAAIWHNDHWVDRSAMLKGDGVSRDTARAVKVVLFSLDRNLRLKARSRQLPAASEKDMASILATGT